MIDEKIIKEIAGMRDVITLASLLNCTKYQRYAKWINARIRAISGDDMSFIKNYEDGLW